MIALMWLVHMGVVLFGQAPSGAFEASEMVWWEALWASHASMAAVSSLLLVATWLPEAMRPRSVDAWIGEVTYSAYLAMGVASALNDQRQFSSNINAYLVAALVPGLVFRLRTAPVVVMHLLAITALLGGLPFVQPSDAARLSVSVIAPVISLLGMGLTHLLTSFARTEHGSRIALESQRAEIESKNAALASKQAELEALNSSLEKRVADQVEEIVVRAREVDVLNAQLMERVQERSRELSSALARLARNSGGGGALKAGSVLGDRVRIESVIGQGGMGIVYLGHDVRTESQVAVKVIQAASVSELDSLHRFLQEARSAASVQHPAIVRTLHVDVSEDGELFQIQELVVGIPLDAWLAGQQIVSIELACRIGGVLSEALAAAHAQGIVHRDVKPANIILTKTGVGLKLLDFGISKMAETRREHGTLTREGLVVGTPAFMSPEQITDPVNVGDRTDVYAAGLVLYHALAGRSPFAATSASLLLVAQVTVDPEPLERLRPELPTALYALIHQTLDKDPEKRPSASEFARALHALADGLGAASLDALVSTLEAPTPRAATPKIYASAVATRQAPVKDVDFRKAGEG
jgi:serine/threonine-protein kinase